MVLTWSLLRLRRHFPTTSSFGPVASKLSDFIVSYWLQRFVYSRKEVESAASKIQQACFYSFASREVSVIIN